MKKITTEEFIEQARKIHGDKYDYSKVKYMSSRSKVCIVCPIHGEFWQIPYSHLRGIGCPSCGGTKKMTTEGFIEKARKVHGDKYDYSKVEYVNSQTKVCIICPIHGEFWQNPNNHINLKQSCYKCKGLVHDLEDFIKKARKVHGNKYDYSKVEYKGAKGRVCIICPKHGEFMQTSNDHLNGNGCQKCACEHVWDSRGRITTENFVSKAKEVHGDKYDYSKTEYKNTRTKVEIICHKKYKNGIEHGSFFQKPNSHLSGNGCPHCRNSQLENKVLKLLRENKIIFEKEKTYDWLVKDGHMYLDFYLPEYNVAIECQGVQHYTNIKIRGINRYDEIHENDLLKNKLCKENDIKIFYFTDENMYKNYCKHKESTYYDFDSMIIDIKK